VPTAFVPTRRVTPQNLFSAHDFLAQRAFFANRPELTPTPLRRRPALARHLGIAELLVKDETERFGLNAFKAAGAAFAISTLQARGEIRSGDTLVCASEGNHGRAVAHVARQFACDARVYMSDSVSPPRAEAISGEGADVVLVRGSYDDAVRQMAREAAEQGWVVISDTSWSGYSEIPRLIMLGYTRLMDEAEAHWGSAPPPDAVFVPGGVGGLLAAVACWGDWRYGADRPLVVAVEPVSAACLEVSARHGRPTPVPGPFETVMGGLRCGEMSPDVFPAIGSLVDAFVAIEDEIAFEAMRLLAHGREGDPDIVCGASGAAALGGLLAAVSAPGMGDVKERLRLGVNSRILLLVTEGATDPELVDDILGGSGGPRTRSEQGPGRV
jgi:diaminopropionate ammonia-lyase